MKKFEKKLSCIINKSIRELGTHRSSNLLTGVKRSDDTQIAKSTRSSANSAGYFIQLSGQQQYLLRRTFRDLLVNIIHACDYSSVCGRLKMEGHEVAVTCPYLQTSILQTALKMLHVFRTNFAAWTDSVS
jgi:hypothetical protein